MKRSWQLTALITLFTMLLSCSGGGGGGGGGTADYTLSVNPAGVSLSQGASVMMKTSVARNAGTSAEVTITVANPPAGVEADVLILSGSVSSGYLRISLAPDAATGGPLDVVITGITGSRSATAHFSLTVIAAQPSSQAKIKAALEAGTIDYSTSLLYRAYALYGDARLPAEYIGSGSDEEDNDLRPEIVTAETASALAPDMVSALEPFTVRPADPKSWYNQVSPSVKPRSGKSGKSGAVQAAATTASWAWSTIPGANPVRIWVQTSGDPAYDVESVSIMSAAINILDGIYGPMTALMGQPIPDEDGADSSIDVYIVDSGSSVNRAGEELTPHGFGTTYPDKPYAGKTASGFIVIPRSLFYSIRFPTTLIHEFFHVLQNAHNESIKHGHYWFGEASARWASVYYDRTLGPWPHGRAAYWEAHHAFHERFQKSTESLNASHGPQMYDAYIWAYFLEQQTGGPALIADIWTKLEGAGTAAGADAAIDSLYSFKDNYRIFAVRNLNTEFLPGDPLPKTDRYISLDSEFRDDKKEPPYGGGPLAGDSELPYYAELEPLSADYLKFTVSDPAVKQVVFDLAGLAASPELDVDAMIKTDKGWEHRDLNGKTELKFCFNKQGEALEDIRFVLSNHQYAAGQSIPAGFTAKSFTAPCAGTWSGTFSYTNAYSDGVTNQSVVWSGSVTWGHPVAVNGWTTEYGVDSSVSTLTVDGSGNGCTFHGEQAVSLPTGTSTENLLTLYSDGSYVATLSSATSIIVNVNYACPPPDGNYTAAIAFPAGWMTTTSGALPVLINGRMQGDYIADMPPFYERWTWDFGYAP